MGALQSSYLKGGFTKSLCWLHEAPGASVGFYETSRGFMGALQSSHIKGLQWGFAGASSELTSISRQCMLFSGI